MKNSTLWYISSSVGVIWNIVSVHKLLDKRNQSREIQWWLTWILKKLHGWFLLSQCLMVAGKLRRDETLSVRYFLGCCLYTALVNCRRRLTENAFQKWYWNYEPSITRTGAFNKKWINLQNVCGMLSQNVVEAGMRHEHTVADTYSPQNLVTFILRAYYIIWLVSAGLAHPVIFKVRIIFDSRRQPVVETSNVGTRTHF